MINCRGDGGTRASDWGKQTRRRGAEGGSEEARRNIRRLGLKIKASSVKQSREIHPDGGTKNFAIFGRLGLAMCDVVYVVWCHNAIVTTDASTKPGGEECVKWGSSYSLQQLTSPRLGLAHRSPQYYSALSPSSGHCGRTKHSKAGLYFYRYLFISTDIVLPLRCTCAPT